jgi:hypothetical protein
MRPGEVRDALIAPREVSQDPTPRRIGERSEGSIQNPGRIFNHLVNHLSGSSDFANRFFQELKESSAVTNCA